MNDDDPLEVRVRRLPARTFGAEIRHMTGMFALIIAPIAYAFGYLAAKPAAAVLTVAVLLLLSTFQPKPDQTRRS